MRNLKTQHIACLVVLIYATTASAQQPRINPAGIDGSLMLCGSYKPPIVAFDRFVELAGGAKAKIVIVTAEKSPWLAPPREQLADAAKKRGAVEPVVVDYHEAEAAFRDATGVWLHVDSVSSWSKALKAKSIAEPCLAVMRRGGVIASAAAGVRYPAVRELAINTPAGLNLLPESIVELRGKKNMPMLPKSSARWKDLVGYEIAPDAVMLVKGRTISVMGEGAVHIYLPSTAANYYETVLKGDGKADLTALRRALRDRLDGFPPAKVETPNVAKGTLVIVGGGGSPEGLYKKFVEYAGGPEKAVIVIFPTANADPLPKREVIAQQFRKAGAKKATVLYAKTQAEVESKEFLDALKEATGLWFDGGRQWRFVDCYENTKALPLMFDVLERDGVIGGTSAGATIQGEYLARGGVFDNFDIRYQGYERGLGFLKGVAIDQHFTQRKRQGDMTKLMKISPQYLGVGLDEATAIVVKGSTAAVIGKGRAHFYDAQRRVEAGQPDFDALPAGGRYDLKLRKVLNAAK